MQVNKMCNAIKPKRRWERDHKVKKMRDRPLIYDNNQCAGVATV